jgi:hypothetical protein
MRAPIPWWASPPARSARDARGRSGGAVRDGPLGRDIPAGLDRGLLTAVVTVHSDLLARRSTLRAFDGAISATDTQTGNEALHGLGTGAAARRRFAADLATLRARAAAHGAVAVQSPARWPGPRWH